MSSTSKSVAWVRTGHAVLGLLLVQASACRDSFDGAPLDGIDVQSGTGTCPVPGPLPFETPTTSFQSSDAVDWSVENPHVTHGGQDLLGMGEQQIVGTMTRSAGTLISQRGVVDEWVSFWRRDGSGGWAQLGRVKTDGLGGFSLTLGADQQYAVGTGSLFSVLEGDGTCAVHGAFVWPAGTKVIVTDIDGTLTVDDNELLKQVMGEPLYEPKANRSSSEMLNAWAQKGYQVAYLSARPHNLRGISRVWLHSMGAPFGPMRTADTFVHGESARTYKAQFLERVQSELGWEIVAVYGNADSDIQAYEDAGIPKGVTFIVGELAGQNGTVAIGNNDYTEHVATYVGAQPDAQQPL